MFCPSQARNSSRSSASGVGSCFTGSAIGAKAGRGSPAWRADSAVAVGAAAGFFGLSFFAASSRACSFFNRSALALSVLLVSGLTGSADCTAGNGTGAVSIFDAAFVAGEGAAIASGGVGGVGEDGVADGAADTVGGAGSLGAGAFAGAG